MRPARSGASSIDDLDLPAVVALYTERAGAQPGPLSASTAASRSRTSPVGRRGRGVQDRPRCRAATSSPARRATPGTATSRRSPRRDRGRPTSPRRTRSSSASLADLFEAVRRRLRRGLRPGGARRQGRDGVGRIARIAYRGRPAGQPPELRVEDIEFAARTAAGGSGASVSPASPSRPTAEGLKALADKPPSTIDPAALRSSSRRIGTIRFSGLDFDVPNEGEAPTAGADPLHAEGYRAHRRQARQRHPDRISTSVRELHDAVAGRQQGRRASDDLRHGLQHARPVLRDRGDAGTKPASELVDPRAVLAAGRHGRRFAARHRRRRDQGRLRARTAPSRRVACRRDRRSLDLTVENDGPVRAPSRAGGAEAEESRRRTCAATTATAAAIGVPALLGNSSQAKAIGQAVARFVAKPGRLVITAKAKDPAGLGVADVAASATPDGDPGEARRDRQPTE